MTKPLKHFHISQLPTARRLHFATAAFEPPSQRHRSAVTAATVIRFPRPDASVLNETIPLFYIGQNNLGFWVAREAQGRCGGLFLVKSSAVRFARKKSAPAGCAIMIVPERLELDLGNQGSRIAESVAVAIDAAARHAPGCTAFIAAAWAEWRRLVAQISRALSSERRHREAIEHELFRHQYRLSSKNDDDLPIL
jgi:hypothetical protein